MDTQKLSHFLVLWSTLFILFDLYFSKSLIKFIKGKALPKFWISALWIANGLVFILFILRIWLRQESVVPNFFSAILLSIPILWYAPKLIIVPFLLMIDLINILKKIFINLFRKNVKSQSKDNKSASSKRRILKNLAWSLVLIVFLGTADGLLRINNSLYIKSVNVPLKGISLPIKELKIVQISDLHAGTFITPRVFENLVWMVRSINPDFIFITGDFVNFSSNELKMIMPQLKSLTANYGTFGILGNHDHYMGTKDHLNLKKLLKEAGIDILTNENRTIKIRDSEIQIAGVDNISYRMNHGDYAKAFKGLRSEIPTILLSHDPYSWESEVVGKFKADLTLSGHTHGGQFGIQYEDLILSPLLLEGKYVYGLHRIKEQYIYINTGIGSFNPPVRIGIKPEITLIRFTEPESITIF